MKSNGEIATHKILIYGKRHENRASMWLHSLRHGFSINLGTYDSLMCSPTRKSVKPEQNDQLAPPLPKVFINGTFMGTPTCLGPMEKGSTSLLKEAFQTPSFKLIIAIDPDHASLGNPRGVVKNLLAKQAPLSRGFISLFLDPPPRISLFPNFFAAVYGNNVRDVWLLPDPGFYGPAS